MRGTSVLPALESMAANIAMSVMKKRLFPMVTRGARDGQGARALSSFAELYRSSVDNAIVRPGDALAGSVVGRRRPRSSSSRFYVVDFGMKTEVPFSSRELPGASSVGDTVGMPLVELETDFNEPQFDYERRSELPAVLAERYELLTRMKADKPQLLHGRFATFRKGGASVKVLGTDAFSPRHHVVGIDRPLLGSYAPFYVLSMDADARGTGSQATMEISPVVSSYGGFLFALCNLIGLDSSWKASGGGSAKDRLSYLRFLTRLLQQKNTSVRRIMPRHAGQSSERSQPSPRRRNPRRSAWLDDNIPHVQDGEQRKQSAPLGRRWDVSGIPPPRRAGIGRASQQKGDRSRPGR